MTSTRRRVLMIAYHFPPLAGSSGIQRTLRFVQHLPAFDWEPLVLTASPRAYERVSADLERDIPAGTVVRRAFALDTARHLAFRGRYVAAMARPDRWASWRFDAVRQGMAMIRRYRPDVIWSTYPIATAHAIAGELHRRSGVPWIADFRDPMAQDDYPTDPVTWAQYERIERAAIEHSRYGVFTTPSAGALYQQRYPAHADRVVVLENGYDEETFSQAASLGSEPLTAGALTLLHSGVVYPADRDPTQLMAALRQLHDAGVAQPGRLKVRFRAAVSDDLLRTLAARYGVEDFVELCPPVPYREALAEMLRADALLVMQGSSCNAQIPAKAYEYLRAARPVLCLADPAGDTAATIRASGIDAIAPLDDAQAISDLLRRFMQSSHGATPLRTLATEGAIHAASRRGRAEALAGLLSTAVTSKAP